MPLALPKSCNQNSIKDSLIKLSMPELKNVYISLKKPPTKAHSFCGISEDLDFNNIDRESLIDRLFWIFCGYISKFGVSSFLRFLTKTYRTNL